VYNNVGVRLADGADVCALAVTSHVLALHRPSVAASAATTDILQCAIEIDVIFWFYIFIFFSFFFRVMHPHSHSQSLNHTTIHAFTAQAFAVNSYNTTPTKQTTGKHHTHPIPANPLTPPLLNSYHRL